MANWISLGALLFRLNAFKFSCFKKKKKKKAGHLQPTGWPVCNLKEVCCPLP